MVIGERWSRIEYHTLVAAAYLVSLALWLGAGLGPGVLLPLLSLPSAGYVARQLAQARTYHTPLPLSPRTGQLLVSCAVLFGAGFWL